MLHLGSVVTPVAGTSADPQLKTAPAREPLPPFYPDVPGPSRTVLDPADPRWTQVRDLRQQAWERGIRQEDLNAMFSGYCPDQITDQIFELEDWLSAH